MDHDSVIEATRRWIAEIVIGLNLCPFAQRVFKGDKIRYAVTDAADDDTLLEDLTRELKALAATPIAEVETTLLIHPCALEDFFEYAAFLASAERKTELLGLRGTIQIASFHPRYQFADAPPDADENYTNRSPFPMLHLLREESITAVSGDPEELLAIPRRNIATLQALGREQILARLRAIRGDSDSTSP
jgi:hypothetical protein